MNKVPDPHMLGEKGKTKKIWIDLYVRLSGFRTCYAANPRPDALMKEQLVEMTGLSPRVIRVWFQNKRCKDKKKTLQLKMQMQQEKVVIYLLVYIIYLLSTEIPRHGR